MMRSTPPAVTVGRWSKVIGINLNVCAARGVPGTMDRPPPGVVVTSWGVRTMLVGSSAINAVVIARWAAWVVILARSVTCRRIRPGHRRFVGGGGGVDNWETTSTPVLVVVANG